MEHVSGSYASDTVNGKTITGMTGTPDVVIFKGGANSAVMIHSAMPSGNYKPIGTATLLQTGGPTLTSVGFTIAAADATAYYNAAATTYYYEMFRDNGAGDFCVFNYTQNNTDNRNITLSGLGSNTPSFALIAGSTAQLGVTRFRCESGDASTSITGSEAADLIQSFGAGTLQVGNNVKVNGNTAATFYGFALSQSTLFYAFSAAYTGTGSAHNETDGSAGMTGDHAWVKVLTGTTGGMAHRHSSETGSNSLRWDTNAEGTTQITALVANGVTVGTSIVVNGNTDTYAVALLKNGLTTAAGTRLLAQLALLGVQ